MFKQRNATTQKVGLTFDTSTSLFQCVDVGVNTTFTVQLVPSQVPRQEALLEEKKLFKNCIRNIRQIDGTHVLCDDAIQQ